MVSFKRTAPYGMVACLFGLLLVLGMVGCEEGDRFRLPEHQRRLRPKEQLTALKLKTKVPTDIPPWTEMSKALPGRLFQPEPVRLRGQLWLREGSSKAFEFYFMRENNMMAVSVSSVADSITAFLRQWMDRPFSRRLQVVLMPESDPGDAAFPWPKTRVAVPSVLPPSHAIYTGNDQIPYLSKFGRVGALTDVATRLLMTGKPTPKPADYWRSIVIPAYFAFRGTCAMLDANYDKTALPKFRQILDHVGRPSAQELKRYWQLFREGKLQEPSKQRAIRSAMAVLGYIEDQYSRGALAVILRRLQRDRKLSFWRAPTEVLGQKTEDTWRLMQRFYFPHAWKRTL